MRVDHMVWFKFKPEVSEDRIDDLMQQLEALQGVVPGILEIRTGKNFTQRSQGHTHALVVILESKAALEAYGPHAAHQKVVAQLREVTESILALDIEF